MTTTANGRTADHPIAPIFLERWAPRAFAAEPILDETLLTILEAARWAPSASNLQPWRFLYAKRDTPSWQRFFDLLIPFNQSWAKDAAALVVIVSRIKSPPSDGKEGRPIPTHSFDAGAAWASLALQARKLDWHAHGMAGFDKDAARVALNVPDDFHIDAAVAIGRLGDKSLLPEGLQAREVPSDRRPLAETAFEGGFPAG